MQIKSKIVKTVKPKNVARAAKSVGIVPPGVSAAQDLVNRQKKKTKHDHLVGKLI